VSSDSLVVETTYEDDENEAKFELEFSFETEEIIMTSEYLEEGQVVEGEYEIEILEINEDSYVFNFIDLNTGEEYIVDS
ncbi:SAR2788 family putative toxin, partial [Anaerobacillus sp. 1_MG-2023]